MGHEITKIAVTTTAKSKAYRMYSEWELSRRIRRVQGRLWRKRGTHAAEYHLLTSDDLAIVVSVEDGTAVMITQMHQHPDYHRDDRFERASNSDWQVALE